MDAWIQFEIQFNLFVQSLGEWLLLPMQFFSFLGQEEFFMMVLPLVYWCIDAGIGLRLGIMLVFTVSTNTWLKWIFQTPRPYWVDQRVEAFAVETSYGMPSAHVQNTTAMWGLAARSFRKRWLTWLSVAIVVLVALSRMYLGVHSLSQVVVACLVGLFILWLFLKIDRPVSRFVAQLSLFHLELAVIAISLLLVLVSVLLSMISGYVAPEWVANASAAAGGIEPEPVDPAGMVTLAGTWLGLAGGAAWDWRKHGQLRTGGIFLKRALRYLVGIIGVVVLWFGLKAILPASSDILGYALRFLRYTLVGLWVTALAPEFFRRSKLV